MLSIYSLHVHQGKIVKIWFFNFFFWYCRPRVVSSAQCTKLKCSNIFWMLQEFSKKCQFMLNTVASCCSPIICTSIHAAHRFCWWYWWTWIPCLAELIGRNFMLRKNWWVLNSMLSKNWWAWILCLARIDGYEFHV